MKRIVVCIAVMVVIFETRSSAVAQVAIDNNCEARLLSSGGGYLYWIDVGKKRLNRSKLENGTLGNSDAKAVDGNAKDVTLAADDDGTLYWIDPDGGLRMGKIDGNGDRKSTANLGSGFGSQKIAAGGGHLYIKNGNILRKHAVVGNVLQPGQIIDDNCTARSFGVVARDKLFWVDTDGSSHLGTVQNGQLRHDSRHEPSQNADPVAASRLGLFWKHGRQLFRSQ